MMVQFFAQQRDEEKCRASLGRRAESLTGLSMSGKVQIFTGVVRSVQTGETIYPDYPLLVTIEDQR
jgi:hypothetical protein